MSVEAIWADGPGGGTPITAARLNDRAPLRGTHTNPNGNVTGNPGNIYINTAGGASQTLWIKETGTGNTGWVVANPASAPVLDIDATSGSLSHVSNALDNLVSNGRFDSWSSLTNLPNSWNQITASSVTQLPGLASGTSLAQVTFAGAFQEMSQLVPQLFTKLVAGDWVTVSAKIEKISGTGNARLLFIRNNYPFDTYNGVSPLSITAGSGPQTVMFSAQVGFTEDCRVQFQSLDNVSTVWKVHKIKVQRGKNVASDWTPTIEEASGSKPDYTAHPVDVSTSPQKFNISPNAGFTRVLLTYDSFVNFLETTDDKFRQFFVIIEQDSVGGRRCYFQPGTIIWADGAEPKISGAPGSFTLMRCAWLGSNYGLFIDATVGISAYRRKIADPYNGNNIGIGMYFMRGTTPAAVDAAVNTLLRYSTAAHRAIVGGNGASLGYAGKFSADLVPQGAPQRGGGLDFYYGYELAGGPSIYGSPIPYGDATLHEYYHAEHDYYFPTGYGPETATTGPYAPYNGQTYMVLLHPVINSCWLRSYNASSTRTVSITTTNGSTNITSSAAFVSGDVSGSIAGCGITATGIPAASTRNVTGSTTLGFGTINITSGAFTNADLGAGLSGTGIPANSYICQVNSSSQVVINNLATAAGSGLTLAVSQPVQITSFNNSSSLTISAAATASGTVTATITYPSGNRSALAEWYSQMRTSMKASAVGDDACYGTLLQDAGGNSAVVTDFQNFITHVGITGG